MVDLTKIHVMTILFVISRLLRQRNIKYELCEQNKASENDVYLICIKL